MIKLHFEGFKALVLLKYHLAPEIIGKLIRYLPIDTYVYPSHNNLYMRLNIGSGGIQKISKLIVGDVFYDVTQDALGISLNVFKASFSQIKIGEIIEGLDSVKTIKKVLSVKIASIKNIE